MTYKNFKDELKKMKLHFWVLPTYIAIINKRLGGVAYIDTKNRFSVSIISEFYNLDENLQIKVFELATELAKTPLDERGKIQ